MIVRPGENPAHSTAIDKLVKLKRSRDRLTLTYAAAIFATTVLAMAYCGVLDPEQYAGALGRSAQIASEALPPDFSRWRNWIWPLVETLAMSIASTMIGASVALVLSALVARNVTPLGILSAFLRGSFNVLRSMPELVLGIVLVASIGFGPLAGVIALALHSTGMLGKFFAEFIEHADAGPIEALRAQGASRIQTFCLGILPQVLPRMVDLTLYRWEHNLRAATVMGLVGAGGIGFELIAALRLFEYREALALLILTFILVTIIDVFGGVVRLKWLVN